MYEDRKASELFSFRISVAKKEPLATNSKNKVRVRTSERLQTPSFKFKSTLYVGLSINSSKDP